MTSVIKNDDIHVKQFKTGCLAQYTYVIESQGQIAIIDPLRDVASYLALAAESNAKVVWVLETHYHADFVSGHVELAKLSGATIVFGPDSNPAFDCKVAKHNEVLPLGNHSLRVLHTPGHTFESSSYVLESPEGKSLAVFTGDTLFLGDVGRPDLAQKGEFTDKDLAKLMFHSLKLLKNLPDDCLILPAHGAGSACGKNIQPGDHCSIGNQKKTNKAFGEEDEEKFIEMATANIAPPPSYFGLSISLNKSPEIDSVHQVVEKGFQSLNPDQVKELAQDESVFILDCRPAGEFIQGHVPHSVWVPLDMTFAIWAAFVVDPRKGEKVVLVTPPGKEKEAVTRLTRTGIDCVVGYLDGGFDSWKQAGFDFGETKVVDFDSHDDFQAKIEGARVVDVRNLGEWQDGVLDHATLLTLSKVKEGTATSSDKKQKIIMQCRTGMRSLMAASLAIRLGWTDVANLAGGIEKIKTKNVAISPMNKQPVATL